MKLLAIILGFVMLAAATVVALNYSDWQAQKLITARLAALPSPMHAPVFRYARDVHGWCGTAQAIDQRSIGFFATVTGDDATVTLFPGGIQHPDSAHLTEALYAVCFHTGQFSYLNLVRLYRDIRRAQGNLRRSGAAPVKAVSLNGGHYRIPGDYVWGRMPANGDAETTENTILLRGRMPDFAPGTPHDRLGRDQDTMGKGGLKDHALLLTQTVKIDPPTLSQRLRATRFGQDDVVSRQEDRDSTHILYHKARMGEGLFAYNDVYERHGSDDFVVCPRSGAPFPSCDLYVVDGSLLHQLTFGESWLDAKWRAADAVRAQWRSWRVN